MNILKKIKELFGSKKETIVNEQDKLLSVASLLSFSTLMDDDDRERAEDFWSELLEKHS